MKHGLGENNIGFFFLVSSVGV